MPRININVGTVANDGTGDDFRVAAEKINDNFQELYAETAADSQIEFDGNTIKTNQSNADLVFQPAGTGRVRIYDHFIIDNNYISFGRSNDDINIRTQGTGAVVFDNISIKDNNITSIRSNDDINIIPSGNGTITINNLKIDGNVLIKDNTIASTLTNSDLVFDGSGSGSVTTDSIDIRDNTIKANTSNADLELDATGYVRINGVRFPNSDGSASQLLRTDGSGILSFATPDIVTEYSAISDGTVSNSDSSEFTVDSFSASTHRSAKYTISVADSTNTRYETVEASVVHDGSSAYVNSHGSITNYSGPLLTFDADISAGNVRLRATPISNDTVVIKFLKRTMQI